MKRNPNGYGGITKLTGNRKKPYMIYKNVLESKGTIIPPDIKKSLKTQIKALQKAETIEEIARIRTEALFLLNGTLSVDIYKKQVKEELEKAIEDADFKSVYKKKPIGYFATLKEANLALAEYNKNPYDIDATKATVKEVFDKAFEEKLPKIKSQSNLYRFKTSFNKLTDIYDMPISNITLKDLQVFMDAEAGTSKSNQRNMISTFRLIFDYAEKYKLINENPCKYLVTGQTSEPKEKNAFSKSEIELLWNHSDDYAVKVILILIYTGMRINELLNLKSEDVDLQNRLIDVNGTKTKSSIRIIPIHSKILPLIKSIYESEYVVAKYEKYSQKYPFFSKDFSAVMDELKMVHTIHETRHSFATYSVNMNPAIRAFVIGHSTNITNDIYTHPEELKEILLDEIEKLTI